MQRTFVIGDIHGALKALQQLVNEVNLQPTDRLIFLGDLVDGWSQSFEVVEIAMTLSKTNPCIFIKGNHDIWCLDWLKTGYIDQLWFESGGEATIKSYQQLTESAKATHIHFIENMVDFYVDDENRLFIHAGFSSVRGPQHERYANSYWWDRTLWETAIALDPQIPTNSVLYPKRLNIYKEIYIGHTPTLHIGKDKPVFAANVWNMDTGAAFTGKLSMLDVDTKELWQSDQVTTLYPNEKGRNS